MCKHRQVESSSLFGPRDLPKDGATTTRGELLDDSQQLMTNIARESSSSWTQRTRGRGLTSINTPGSGYQCPTRHFRRAEELRPCGNTQTTLPCFVCCRTYHLLFKLYLVRIHSSDK